MRRLSLTLLGVVVVAVAACQAELSPSPSTTPTPPIPTVFSGPSPAPTPRAQPSSSYRDRVTRGEPGGEITVGAIDEPTTANPYAGDPEYSSTLGSALWAGLLTESDDLRYTPNLSLDVPTIDNGAVVVPEAGGGDAMTVEWWLKPDLRWSDGEPLTCDDFRFTREWLLGIPDSVGRTGIESLDEIECPGDDRMIWRFSEINEGYLRLLRFPLPRHELDGVSPGDVFGPAGMVGMPVSGPFMMASWDPGGAMTLIRNPFHRGLAFDAPALLDRITFTWFAHVAALVDAYRDGAIDIALGLSGHDRAGVEDFGDEARTTFGTGTDVLRLNWAPGSLAADPAIRQAISLAIDRGALARMIDGPDAVVASTSVSPSSWFFSEQTPVERDLDAARMTLEDAGWIDADGNGRRERNGIGAELVLCASTDAWATDVAGSVAASLGDIGIDPTVRAVPVGDLIAGYESAGADAACSVARGNYDVALQELGGSIDPGYLFTRYHSSQVPPAGENAGRVADPKLDEALEGIRTTVNFAVIKEIAGDVQRRAAEIVVEIPISYGRALALARVANFFPAWEPTWNVADWFVAD